MIKRVLVLAAVSLFFLSTSYAQMKMDPAQRVEELTEELELTDEQAEQVENIFTDFDAKMKEIFENGDPRDESTRTEMDSLRTENENAIMEILTEDQQTKYKELLEEQKQRMEEHRPPQMN